MWWYVLLSFCCWLVVEGRVANDCFFVLQTQQFRTGHQVLGLLTVVALTLMFLWGIGLSWIKRSAKKRGQEPPESTHMLGLIHRWACRLIWVLLLINVGV